MVYASLHYITKPLSCQLRGGRVADSLRLEDHLPIVVPLYR